LVKTKDFFELHDQDPEEGYFKIVLLKWGIDRGNIQKWRETQKSIFFMAILIIIW